VGKKERNGVWGGERGVSTDEEIWKSHRGLGAMGGKQDLGKMCGKNGVTREMGPSEDEAAEKDGKGGREKRRWEETQTKLIVKGKSNGRLGL